MRPGVLLLVVVAAVFLAWFVSRAATADPPPASGPPESPRLATGRRSGARLYLEGENAGALLMLQIFDAQGRPAVRTESADGYFDIDRQHLRPGLYFFRITSASGKWIGSGKLSVY